MRLDDMLPIAEKLDKAAWCGSWGGILLILVFVIRAKTHGSIRELSKAMPTPSANAVARTEFVGLPSLRR